MMVFGFELIKYMLKIPRFINKEACTNHAHILTAHELLKLPNTVLLTNFVFFIG